MVYLWKLFTISFTGLSQLVEKSLAKREKSFWVEESGDQRGTSHHRSCSQELGAKQTCHPIQSSPAACALADCPESFRQYHHTDVLVNPKQPQNAYLLLLQGVSPEQGLFRFISH